MTMQPEKLTTINPHDDLLTAIPHRANAYFIDAADRDLIADDMHTVIDLDTAATWRGHQKYAVAELLAELARQLEDGDDGHQ